ncbi:uncharacterized protein SPSK_08194 [Sporothrix schenckii 1099-18]|uniref:Uncharacterized protein n=1 Tax=Sporothrix schenckii 1099-18 TaxID=1397361 RepID=A0A0F2MGJ1_SPOSC|nr:uncharacterized protein SPSK_08194 [Sporothrix schenckii 1099-18]KJR88823.1 hypothetical protein SPSK_08194 [Sporothrix schenckii 1099-18]
MPARSLRSAAPAAGPRKCVRARVRMSRNGPHPGLCWRRPDGRDSALPNPSRTHAPYIKRNSHPHRPDVAAAEQPVGDVYMDACQSVVE